MPVVGRALLPAVGLADGTIQVEDQFLERLSLVDLVDPPAGKIDQRREVALSAEHLGLEPTDLAGRSMLLRQRRSPADNVPHRGIDGQSLRVVHVFITGQPAVDRLPQERHESVLFVAPLT